MKRRITQLAITMAAASGVALLVPGVASAHTTRPRSGTSAPAEARALAVGPNVTLGEQMASGHGWTGAQWDCLNWLWTRESGWNQNARNTRSGAYGIPQSLPARKMAIAGADWQTNPATQIGWGLTYIAVRYGDPCAAKQHEQHKGWY